MEEEAPKRREKGTGSIRKIEEHKYYGRLTIGKNPNGKAEVKCFTGKTEADVKGQIRKYNLKRDVFKQENVVSATLEEYMLNWLRIYKYPELKPSSYDSLEKTVKTYIIPNLGYIQVGQISSDDIQSYLNTLSNQNKILSLSSVKRYTTL